MSVVRNSQALGADPVVLNWKGIASARPDPVLLEAGASRLSRWAPPIISLAILGAVGLELSRLDVAGIRALLPTSVGFWLVFVAYYASAPLADWVIFRRLWNIPIAGFFALVRKLIGNELLLGYVGELYFYSWARKRSTMVGAPFGAVKDVAILSAVVGNVVTLAMLGLTYPLFRWLHLGIDARAFTLSVGVVLLTSLAAMLYRKKLFSLPRRNLQFILKIHFVRVVLTTGLAAWMWHIALPSVSISLWLLLSTLRLLLSRLPFVPNKDVVFAGMAIFLVGQDHAVVELMALMAGIILTTHLLIGLALAGAELLEWSSGK